MMAGRLAPGERLKEELLAQTHAVSRATVREALIALARQGYVVRIPRFGARIAELSRHDLDDLFELRAALLGLAAGRFARRAEAADGQMLEAMVAELEASANDERVSPQAFADQSIRLQTLLTDSMRATPSSRHLQAAGVHGHGSSSEARRAASSPCPAD